MAFIRRVVPGDAQKIGAVFDAVVREGWTYLGELAREPMFPPDEWDKVVIEHEPPNVLLVAIDEPGNIVGFLPSIHGKARCSCCSFIQSTLAAAWAAHCSMLRMKRCEPQAAAKRFSTRTKITKERSPYTRPPGIDATAPCVNRTFAVYTCASHEW
jgi:hypothetical protein